MIISKKWLTSILAASLLFGFAGCKKDAPKSQDEVTQKVQALADGKWDKAEVNALLAFVPEDTPFVFASTRESFRKNKGCDGTIKQPDAKINGQD